MPNSQKQHLKDSATILQDAREKLVDIQVKVGVISVYIGEGLLDHIGRDIAHVDHHLGYIKQSLSSIEAYEAAQRASGQAPVLPE